MKRVMLFSVLVALCVLLVAPAPAQTSNVIRDLNNFSTVREYFTNAFNASSIVTGAFTDTLWYDTLYVPGVSSTSIMTASYWNPTALMDSCQVPLI